MLSSRPTSKPTTSAVALRVPDRAFTRSGVAFQPSADRWEWDDGPFRLQIDFRKVDGPYVRLREPLRATLLVYAKGNSGHYVQNLFNALTHLLATRDATRPFASISVEEVSSYAARLKPHEVWRVGTLNVLLQKWASLDLPGVDAACVHFLAERRKPGNEKGAAVRTRDPVSGPFSAAEYMALYKAVDAAYGAGDLPLWLTVLTRLLFACGGRISQYASLKLQDLEVSEGAFALRLPQVKTREVNSRESFRTFDLSPQTGRLVQTLIDQHLEDGWDRTGPLFPESGVYTAERRDVPLNHDALFTGHCNAKALSRVFASKLAAIAPPSERLGFEPTPISPQRFRYTFGTRLVEEGASKTVVGDRLGHVDLQNVDVYFEASPKIVENIDKAMSASLAPLARAFRGRLIEGEEDSTHKGAPGSRIIDFRVSKAPLASCAGKGKGCEFNKPVACYTCFKFEPWLDAPHEKVLQRLNDERKRFASDERLAEINDDAIKAVEEVIAECAQVHAQRGREAST
jgi:integrase